MASTPTQRMRNSREMLIDTPPVGGSALWGTYTLFLLLDLLENTEDRDVERHDHATTDQADEADHERLNERGQLLRRRGDLVVVEVGDLLEHGLESARVLAHRHHLHDHGREDRLLRKWGRDGVSRPNGLRHL